MFFRGGGGRDRRQLFLIIGTLTNLPLRIIKLVRSSLHNLSNIKVRLSFTKDLCRVTYNKGTGESTPT